MNDEGRLHSALATNQITSRQSSAGAGSRVNGDRVAYADAGRAHRLAIEKAAMNAPRLKASQRATLDAVIALTASYSRLEDRVFVAEVAELAGVHESTARRSLIELAASGIVRWEPVRGTGKKSLVGLYPHTETGDVDARSLHDETAHLDSRESAHLDSQSKRASTCARTEKSSEKVSEEETVSLVLRGETAP